ncbi:MAG: hypothetical protein WD016_00755 [Balneolaceae bacterium]
MKKFGYRPTNSGYSGSSKWVFKEKTNSNSNFANGNKIMARRTEEGASKFYGKSLPSAPSSGSAQTKIKD